MLSPAFSRLLCSLVGSIGRVYALADPGGQYGHALYHGFRRPGPSPRLQQEVLEVGGLLRSAFFTRFACDYIKIGVYTA